MRKELLSDNVEIFQPHWSREIGYSITFPHPVREKALKRRLKKTLRELTESKRIAEENLLVVDEMGAVMIIHPLRGRSTWNASLKWSKEIFKAFEPIINTTL